MLSGNQDSGSWRFRPCFFSTWAINGHETGSYCIFEALGLGGT